MWPGVEDVWIKEQGTEREMTSASPGQNRALVLKAFELLFNKRGHDARRTLLVEEPIVIVAAINACMKGASWLSLAGPVRTGAYERRLPQERQNMRWRATMCCARVNLSHKGARQFE